MEQLEGFIHEGAFWSRLWKRLWISRIYLREFQGRPFPPLQWPKCLPWVFLGCHQHREVGRSHTGLGSAFRSCPSCLLFLDRFCYLGAPFPSSMNLRQGPPRTTYFKGLSWGLQESMEVKHVACNEHTMRDRCRFLLTPGKVHVYRLQKTLVPNRLHSLTGLS